MKSRWIVVLAIALGALMFVAACSDKETNPAKTRGDDNDQDYLQAQAMVFGFVDSMSYFAQSGYDYLSFDGTSPLSVTNDTVGIVFDDTNFWWSIYVHSDTTNASVTYLDSVRFEQGAQYSRLPDSATTTGIEYRAMLDGSLVGDSSSLTGAFTEGLHITGIQAEQLVYNGYSSAIIALVLGQSTFNQTYVGSLADVTFNRADLEGTGDPHPVAGTLALAMTAQAASPQGSASRNWSVAITFFVDHYSIHFESGDNYWDWDGPYGG